MLNHPAWQAVDIGGGSSDAYYMTRQALNMAARIDKAIMDNYRQELAMVEIQQTGKSTDNTQVIDREEFKSKLFD